MKKFQFALISFIMLSSPLLAAKNYKQWFIGNILAPSPTTADPSHPSVGLAYFDSKIYGVYDSTGKTSLLPTVDSKGFFFSFRVGFNHRFGLEMNNAYYFNKVKERHFTGSGDTTLRVGMQIAEDQKNSWIPDFRLILEEIFPTGTFQELDFEGNTANRMGNGSFQTGFHLAFQKEARWINDHPFRIRASGGYFIPSRVDVKGINVYGGDDFTRGKAFPGNYAIFYFGLEYALSCKWAIACDSNLTIGEGGDFLRNEGVDIDIPSYYQFSIAPAFEYTWNEDIGFLFGTWFTVSGKNSPAFHLWFATISYTF